MAKIEPNSWYTLQQIVEGEYLTKVLAPWKATYPTVRRLVIAPGTASTILAPEIKGKGTNVRYKVKGENIINFINAVTNGTVQI